jgi:hypothetical protein
MTDSITWPVTREDLGEVLQTAGLNEENAAKALVIFEAAVATRVEEISEVLTEQISTLIAEQFTEHRDSLIESIDEYYEEMVTAINEATDGVSELRNLMLLSVAVIGGQEKANEFIKKVSALARAGSLSSSSGAWAQGAPDDSVSNRATIAGGGASLRKEEVKENDELKAEAAEVFSEAAAGLLAEDVERFKTLAGNVEFDGDVDDLAARLKFIRESYWPGAASQVAPYVRAIARSVRK